MGSDIDKIEDNIDVVKNVALLIVGALDHAGTQHRACVKTVAELNNSLLNGLMDLCTKVRVAMQILKRRYQ